MGKTSRMDETVPVVICERDGAPVDLARQNRKAFEKSIEQGHLWVVTANDRVLPYTDERPVALEARGSWNLARFARAAADAPASANPAEPGGGAGREEERPESAGASGADGTALGTVLAELADVIRTRKRELPEGSYTTHLFQSGSEKIRKKLGEEAVELILASRRDRTVSETADLLYHLLVLLADDGITLDEIAAELRNR